MSVSTSINALGLQYHNVNALGLQYHNVNALGLQYHNVNALGLQYHNATPYLLRYNADGRSDGCGYYQGSAPVINLTNVCGSKGGDTKNTDSQDATSCR